MIKWVKSLGESLEITSKIINPAALLSSPCLGTESSARSLSVKLNLSSESWIVIPRIVSGLVHPSYKWINPTYPIDNWGYDPLTKWDEPPSGKLR